MQFALTVSPEPPRRVPILSQGDLYDGLALAARLGYDAVELHVHKLAALDVSAVRERLAALGLRVSAVSPGLLYGGETFHFCDPDEAVRRRAVDRVRQQIDVCSRLGAKAIVGLIRGRLDQDVALRAQQHEWLAACMREVDAYAIRRGVVLALEPLNRYETNLWNRADEITAFLDENGLRASGLLLDTFHMNIEEPDLGRAIETAGQRLVYVHLADTNRWSPGFGHLDILSVLQALQRIGYEGDLAFETLPLPDPETAARRAIQTVRPLVTGRT